MKEWKRAKGLFAATLTPMNGDGSINLKLIPKYIDHLVKHGITQVYVNGTAGECMSLTVHERQQIAEAWVNEGKGKLNSIILHCGAGNLQDTKTLAAHAQSIGVDCVAAIAPTYFKPLSIESLVEYMRQVANSCSDTPFMYYHFPAITGLPFRAVDWLNLAKNDIPNLIGVKFTSTDLFDAMQCVRCSQRQFDVAIGAETMLLGAISMEMDSAVGVTFSILSAPCTRIIDAFNKGDIGKARIEQAFVQDFWSSTVKASDINSMICTFKYCMSILGLDFGPPRLPIQPLSLKQTENIKNIMNIETLKKLEL